MTAKRFFIALLFFFISSLPAYAEVFQYFDQDGTLIITDRLHRQKKPGHASLPKIQKIPRIEYKEDVSYDYYSVSGSTLREVMLSADINGPHDERENRTYPGQTKWNIGWSYKFAYSYTKEDPVIHVLVDISDFDFLSDITVVLPSLSGRTALSPHELMLWESFMQGLISHEHDHVAIIKDPLYHDRALGEISRLKELYLEFDPYSDIDEMIKKTIENETGKIGHDLMKIIKDRNDEYDRLTEHGLKPDMRDIFFSR